MDRDKTIIFQIFEYETKSHDQLAIVFLLPQIVNRPKKLGTQSHYQK